ncbi:helix-turn-helix domain-containing protein [Weissella kandleri]|uniref:helix-turn-helix domain-containing protein n=1 Tax=Weissella kandleri TaxID=1616 RepID=UPI00387E838E
MSLYERTKQAADARKLSLKYVASQAGLAENAIYRWDTNNPKSENLNKVANVLNVSVDYLLGNTDDLNSARTHAGWSDADLNDAISNAQAFNGKPITESDKKKIRESLIAWLDSDDDEE